MKKHIFISLLLPIVLIILLITGYIFRDDLKKHPVFRVKEITFTKTDHYTPEQLLHLVSPNEAESIFDVDLDEIKFHLKEKQWIKSVSISRIFPNKLSVILKEHQIRGIVLLDQFYYFNHDFKIFMVADRQKITQYPLFTGLTQDLYLNYFEQFKRYLQQMEHIVQIADQSNIGYRVNEVRRTLFKGYEAVLDHQYRVILGDKWDQKQFKQTKKIISLMKQQKREIALILFNEFKDPNKVVVKLKKEQL